MTGRLSKAIRTGTVILFLLLISLIAGTGCASDRKAREIIKRSYESSCDLSHLGRNKYYYSPHYKKRLSSNTRRINRR